LGFEGLLAIGANPGLAGGLEGRLPIGFDRLSFGEISVVLNPDLGEALGERNLGGETGQNVIPNDAGNAFPFQNILELVDIREVHGGEDAFHAANVEPIEPGTKQNWNRISGAALSLSAARGMTLEMRQKLAREPFEAEARRAVIA
jgi:hypothetical protein